MANKTSQSFDISMLVGGMRIQEETLSSRSLGGSESAGIYMARALARCGARLKLFCNTGKGWQDDRGVEYLPIAAWHEHARSTLHDICIVQRRVDAFAQRIHSRLNLLWSHDLALGRNDRAFRGALWNVDRVIVLSRFMQEQYKLVHNVSDDLFLLSRNGVDLQLFDQLADERISRDPLKLVYAARPERGLDLLLRDVMPRLLARKPGLRLYIAGYDNTAPEWSDFYGECRQLASTLGDSVVWLGSLSKTELYRLYMSASVYVYPTPSPILRGFREVSCISAMEAQAAGLPLVSSALGALPETAAPGAGVLVDGDPSDSSQHGAYVAAFVEATLKLVSDPDAWRIASATGRKHAMSLDWSNVAEGWLTDFADLLRARNDSPRRLLRHFWRNSDIVPAESMRLEPNSNTDPLGAEAERLLLPWSFIHDPDGIRKHYEAIGASQPEDNEHTLSLSESRFTLLNNWLRAHEHESASLLDYGCGHGSSTIGLARNFPSMRFHGVDIDRFSIEIARKSANVHNMCDRATFDTWHTESAEPLGPSEFDFAIVQEVLEHAPAPWSLLERVESKVRRGGSVYITVPFGPWEAETYGDSDRRCHVWHFDEHDIRDMLGSKPNLSIDSLYERDNRLTGEPLGWWIVTYTADREPIAAINIERHTWLQRPRQTLSAAIIAGPGCEETLHWTLRSVRDIADEVVIADCGMHSEGRRIARQYDIRLVKGCDPRSSGFDQARNAALDACTGDWCLWIDTDERLVGATQLEKYLRQNTYHAYSLRQQHFSCDTAMPEELPARLFRRTPLNGRTIRFIGAIHEHPEFDVNEGPGPCIALPDVYIAHVGYLSESVRREKFLRNWPLLKLDQVRYPDRLIQKYFLMRENMHLARYGIEQNGGRIDDSIRLRCREVVGLYRRHFLGKRRPHGVLPLEYYSEALTMLGEGFEAAVQLSVDKVEARPAATRRFRFASADDLKTELQSLATESAQGFDSQWW